MCRNEVLVMDEVTYREMLKRLVDGKDAEEIVNDLCCYEDSGVFPWEM
jgi:hypothetical protein